LGKKIFFKQNRIIYLNFMSITLLFLFLPLKAFTQLLKLDKIFVLNKLKKIAARNVK